jgi:hypothetical protein
VLVMAFCASWADLQIGFPSWGVQGRVFKCSSRTVQVGALLISWFPLFDGVSLPTMSR